MQQKLDSLASELVSAKQQIREVAELVKRIERELETLKSAKVEAPVKTVVTPLKEDSNSLHQSEIKAMAEELDLGGVYEVLVPTVEPAIEETIPESERAPLSEKVSTEPKKRGRPKKETAAVASSPAKKKVVADPTGDLIANIRSFLSLTPGVGKTPEEIYEALKEAKQLPVHSNPAQFVRYTLGNADSELIQKQREVDGKGNASYSYLVKVGTVVAAVAAPAASTKVAKVKKEKAPAVPAAPKEKKNVIKVDFKPVVLSEDPDDIVDQLLNEHGISF